MANAISLRRMQMFWRNVCSYENQFATSKVAHSAFKNFQVSKKLSTVKSNLLTYESCAICQRNYSVACLSKSNLSVTESKFRKMDLLMSNHTIFHPSICNKFPFVRSMTTLNPLDPLSNVEPPRRIKFKRLDKTAKHIMNILDKEAVEEVTAERDIPDIRPGYIVQMKVEVPENKRRVSTLKGIVIARRNAGINTTFRLRRLVDGVGIESVFPLYSPNIKEVKILDKKKVRRAKLYYLRDRMNPLKNK